MRLFQQAIHKDPSDAIAYYDLGSAYQAAGNNQDALKQYRLALARDPNEVSALYNEAVIYSVHDSALAEFLYRKVIQLKPDSPTALLNLGLLLAVDGAKAQAGVALRHAIKLDPTLRARIPASVLVDLTAPPPKPRTTNG